MGKVNLELSQKQYEKLVETVYLGTWMVNSTRMELDDEFEDVRELVLAKYKEAGLEDRVVHQEEMDVYDLDVDYESKLLDTYVEEYDEFSFWDKLVEKLADKEMAERYGANQDKMTDEMMEERVQIEEKIGKKLEETGVTKLNFTDE
ncbi:hypothetical protein SAMN05216353_14229 [Halobacillus alkaliphilus]|uniref:Uncharacterized protein n=1 Tax=Halobacillus alkaliphilus TaxID=396056 RepID=A0A1I2RR64_9BACI|nr:hypothetical protein [Halobacillus alkaliphilus]SFG42998.1 hypothetical protein SAMN05216353_14229 [Halobacillus alkaliphilus]